MGGMYLLRESLITLILGVGSVSAEIRRYLFTFVVGFLLSFLSVLAPSYIYDFEHKYLSLLYALRGEREKPKDVVIVGIDLPSYEAAGKLERYEQFSISPRKEIPRRLTAEAIKEIHKQQPKLLVTDLYMAKENNDPVANTMMIEALSAGPTSIGKARLFYDYELSADTEESEGEEKFIESDPIFQKAASYYIPMLVSSRNGVVSDINLRGDMKIPFEEEIPLSGPLRDVWDSEIVRPGPFDQINYYGPAGYLTYQSLYTFLPEYHDKQRVDLKDKIVFLGYQNQLKGRGHSEKDQFTVPIMQPRGADKNLPDKMFGVEIQATITANLIDRSFLKRLDPGGEGALIFMITAFLAFVIQPPLRKAKASLVVLFVAVVLFAGASFYLFVNEFFFLPGPLFLAVFSVLLLLLKEAENRLYIYLEKKRESDFALGTGIFS